ncbi:hypothetical protein BN7_5718 [Wickerhamomyces ciferrii]|uniref:Uncharacterized protein n=1 Tax=Wickerhamomyces ciferrii (strain ATCC 14091 / BCRC 22168 / CBS 111 / JCM 3599 / NBRC 0793 / NRRL Y-1031 F-60-10) TaxID=1206466 RepID=K0KLI9_WICCF|nr:uncharacterized protein BN7_5718 [Wickerhamomyces ciferrii]CCH46130.1 hypothetical protein BN7_5718 [Wickerhamomyces ciferrii]
MILGRIGVPKIIPTCLRPIRQYISLPTPYFNIPKTIRIIEQKKKEQLRIENKLPVNTDQIFDFISLNQNQKEHIKISNRIKDAKSFLGDEYKLNDELITLCLRPRSERQVQISLDESSERTLVCASNFELVGKRLVDLQKTLLILELQLEDKQGNINGLNIDRLEEKIQTIMFSSYVKKKFIKRTILPKIITAHQGALMKQRRALALSSLYTMIGCISFSKGERKAIKFIKDKVLRGDDGIMQLSINEINK